MVYPPRAKAPTGKIDAMKVQISKLKVKSYLLFFLLVFSLLCIFNFKLLTVFAQTTPKNTVSVTPQLSQLDLSIDTPETILYYKNNSQYPIELSLSVQDVRELEDRNPVGILDPKESANYKYSLSSWVTLERQTLLLNPGEERTVKISIAKEKLSPGGHYGTILAEITQDVGRDKVKIKGVLASLLFVRASTGNEIEEAKVNSFAPNPNGISFPEAFTLRFQNTGNVELTPYGLLEIKNQQGKLVAKGIVNEESSITLPEAIRTYTIPVKAVEGFILPGKYTATLTLHYGKSNKKLVSKIEFTTLGSTNLLQGALIFLIIILGLLVALKFLRGRAKRLLKHNSP